MDVTYRIDKDILYVSVSGRIDASNAAQAEEEIFKVKNANPGKHTVLDADNLEYISSAGLRILLAAPKVMNKQGSMVVKNVNEVIAEVFEVAGFSDILTVL